MTILEHTESIASTSLTLDVYDSFIPLESLQRQWDSFVEEAGGCFYMAYDTCRVWWKHYGAGRQLRIIIFRRSNDLAAIFPMFIETIRVGPFPFRLAKLLCSDHTSMLCGPVIEAQYGKELFSQVFEYLLEQEQCDAVWLGPLPGNGFAGDTIRLVCRMASPKLSIIKDGFYGPHMTFLLPGQLSEYVSRLSPNQRGNYRRNLNSLRKGTDLEVDIVKDAQTLESEFQNFVDMHTRQWQAVGRLGHFADWPDVRAFYYDLVMSQAQRGRTLLMRIQSGDSVVSYQLCYRFGNCIYWRLPARRVGDPWDRLGLGRVSMVKMIETAIGMGAARIEAGFGHYRYKEQLGAVEHQAASILIAKNRFSSRIKAHLFRHMSQGIHFLYYRVWFNKISVKMGLPHRPLWDTWIHSRI